MTTMTCRRPGGACALPADRSTADAFIRAQDRHLDEVVAADDTAHGARCGR